ncbi:hypothetical protein [Streptomyces sp. NPDC054834]
MAQDVRGESGAAAGSGFLLLAALLVLQLLHAFVFGVGGELVLDDSVGLRAVDATGGDDASRRVTARTTRTGRARMELAECTARHARQAVSPVAS